MGRGREVSPGVRAGDVDGTGVEVAIGYVCSAVGGEQTDLVDQLVAAGVGRVFIDVVSEPRTGSPQWDAAAQSLAPGDVLVVPELGYLGRSMREVVARIQTVRTRGAQLRALAEGIDTTTAPDRDLFRFVDAIDGVERTRISAGTRAGLAVAAAAGRRPGRPTVMTARRVAAAQAMRTEGASLDAIARSLGVGRGAVTRALAVAPATDSTPPPASSENGS